MKKHNEGYALVLVLVVLTVLGLVAAFILSFSLKNLQNQQASVEQMQDRYAAEGEIEKVIAQLEDLIRAPSGEFVELKNTVYSEADGMIIVKASSGSVQIVCELLLQADSVTVRGDGEYIFTNLTGFEYRSYDISTAEEVDGE